MYFSCFLCCPPSPVGSIPLLSPLSVWLSGKIGRNSNRARHTVCSLLTLTGGGCSLQILLTGPAESSPIGRRGHHSGWGARGRLRGRWDVRFRDARWVTRATNSVKDEDFCSCWPCEKKKKKFGKSVTVSAEDALVSGDISFHAMRKHLLII